MAQDKTTGYTMPAIPAAYAQPATALEALRYLYAIRGRVHYFGSWVKVSVKIGDDISFASHQIAGGVDAVDAFLAAARSLWELLNEWREESQ
jgi:hypothetical protein